jgi:hypothetical protein
MFSTDPFFNTTLLKTYAIIAAIFSWLLAPALFNPAFVNRSSSCSSSLLFLFYFFFSFLFSYLFTSFFFSFLSNEYGFILAEKKKEFFAVSAWLHRSYRNAVYALLPPSFFFFFLPFFFFSYYFLPLFISLSLSRFAFFLLS